MVRRIAALASSALMLAGCASLRDGRGALDDADMRCVVLGGLLGGAAGAAAANRNHGDDEADEAVVGAAVGAILGAVIGQHLCGRRANAAPAVRVSAEPGRGEAPLTVQLRGVASDPDGSIASYHWDLGDGNSASEASVAHTYARAGTYTATLRVTDDRGQSTSASTRVAVEDAVLAPVVQRRIVLRGVNFALDSARIRPADEPILEVAVQVLGENAELRIEVAGHTDSSGSDAYNQGLSERRARAVVNHLVRRGIDGSRLSAVGYGESRPVADNATADGRAQNRRVELSVR